MSTTPQATWLSIPDVAERLDVRLRDVRTMIAENRLAATRLTDEGPLVIPEEFLVMRDGALAPLPALRGTITTLIDGGFSQGEAIAWLLNEEAELGEAPLTALKSGRIHAVRRVAGMLAF